MIFPIAHFTILETPGEEVKGQSLDNTMCEAASPFPPSVIIIGQWGKEKRRRCGEGWINRMVVFNACVTSDIWVSTLHTAFIC